jgi:hypothetical protein
MKADCRWFHNKRQFYQISVVSVFGMAAEPLNGAILLSKTCRRMAAAAQALVLKFALGMVLVVEMVKEHYTSMEYIQLLGFGGSDSSALELCNQKRLGRNCFIFFNVIIK